MATGGPLFPSTVPQFKPQPKQCGYQTVHVSEVMDGDVNVQVQHLESD